MKDAAYRVVCSTAEVLISDVRETRDELLGRFFDELEAEELRDRHPRSTAGRLAAKRAIRSLLEELFEGHELRERDFVLGRSSTGAPKILEMRTTAPITPDSLHISISHTARRAVGLAVYREAR